MSGIRNTSIIEALQRIAQKYGMKEMAAKLDKSPSTLYAELNPWGEPGKAKAGFDDAIEIMRESNDITPLVLVASEFGYHLVADNAAPDRQTISEEVCQDMEAMGQWASVCTDPSASERSVKETAHKLRQEICETEALKLNRIQAGAR